MIIILNDIGCSMYINRLTVLALSSLTFCTSTLNAQVATDGTTGDARTLEGPDFDIGAELGTRAGGNLFHSFEQFSIDTGESATFSGPDSVNNVIGRVTRRRQFLRSMGALPPRFRVLTFGC